MMTHTLYRIRMTVSLELETFFPIKEGQIFILAKGKGALHSVLYNQ